MDAKVPVRNCRDRVPQTDGKIKVLSLIYIKFNVRINMRFEIRQDPVFGGRAAK